MSSILSIAISGLNDAKTRIANAASNIVNASSTSSLPKNQGDAFTGFVPQDIVTLSNSVGGNNLGVSSSLQPRDPAYSPAYDPNSPQANAQGLVATPNVDLNAELVSSSVAKVEYGANAAIIKVANELEKALLDIKT